MVFSDILTCVHIMSYEIYKLIHFFAIISLFLALGALLTYSNSGDRRHKKRIMALHGLSALILFVSGFGLIARLKMHSFPLWLNLKLLIWLILSVLIPVLVSRNIINKKGIWFLVFASGLMAIWLVVFKLAN